MGIRTLARGELKRMMRGAEVERERVFHAAPAFLPPHSEGRVGEPSDLAACTLLTRATL